MTNETRTAALELLDALAAGHDDRVLQQHGSESNETGQAVKALLEELRSGEVSSVPAADPALTITLTFNNAEAAAAVEARLTNGGYTDLTEGLSEEGVEDAGCLMHGPTTGAAGITLTGADAHGNLTDI